jgi:hypothetical protein
MSSGKIVKVQGEETVEILGARKQAEPQILDSHSKTPPTEADYHTHEEVIVEGQNKARITKPGNEVKIQIRSAISQKEWQKVKRLDD